MAGFAAASSLRPRSPNGTDPEWVCQMSVNVEALLAMIEVLAQNAAEQKPLRQRMRENAAAYAAMNLKVQEILKRRREYEADNRSDI